MQRGVTSGFIVYGCSWVFNGLHPLLTDAAPLGLLFFLLTHD